MDKSINVSRKETATQNRVRIETKPKEKKRGFNAVSSRERLTQAILQHCTPLNHLTAPAVLIENPAVPLVVDRDALGRARCGWAWLSTRVRDCWVRDPTRPGCVVTLKTRNVPV